VAHSMKMLRAPRERERGERRTERSRLDLKTTDVQNRHVKVGSDCDEFLPLPAPARSRAPVPYPPTFSLLASHSANVSSTRSGTSTLVNPRYSDGDPSVGDSRNR
jgi:hypothetical protein